MRRAARIDENQKAVVKALRAVGCSVVSLASCGGGVPDLIVGRNGRTWLMEVKDGRRVPSERRLTPAQVEWHRDWKGAPVSVVLSAADALAALEVKP